MGGTSGSDTKLAQPASSQSNRAQTRFSSVGSRNTVEPLEPWSARFSAPLVPNTSRKRSTSSTSVVARIMTSPLGRITVDLSVRRSGSIGVGVILRTGPADGIGRPTHFVPLVPRSAPGDVDDAVLDGPAGRRDATRHADLRVDVLDVVLRGSHG